MAWTASDSVWKYSRIAAASGERGGQHAAQCGADGQARDEQPGRHHGQHAEDLLAPLTDPERVSLGQLLTRLATHHGLTPGVHPGYRAPGRPATADSRAG